jgi:hypothetical protein
VVRKSIQVLTLAPPLRSISTKLDPTSAPSSFRTSTYAVTPLNNLLSVFMRLSRRPFSLDTSVGRALRLPTGASGGLEERLRGRGVDPTAGRGAEATVGVGGRWRGRTESVSRALDGMRRLASAALRAERLRAVSS